MRYDMRKAETIWTIIEKGLEDFNKRAAEEQQKNNPQSQEAAAPVANENDTVTVTVPEAKATNGTSENNVPTFADILSHAIANDSIDKSVRKALKKLKKQSELPTNVGELKRKKFVKLVQSTLKLEGEVADGVYTVFNDSRTALHPINGHTKNGNADAGSNKSLKKRKYPENGTQTIADTSETDGGKKKKTNGCEKENDIDDANDVSENGACDLNNSTFDWEKNISRVFKKHKSNNELDLSFIKSKVLKKYSKENEAASVKLSHIEKKITKVIKKIDKFVVEDDIVKLRE